MINYVKSPIANRQSPIANRQSPIGWHFYCKNFCWGSPLQNIKYYCERLFRKIQLIILIKKLILQFYKYHFYKIKTVKL